MLSKLLGLFLGLVILTGAARGQTVQAGCVNSTPCTQTNVYTTFASTTLAVTTTTANVSFPATAANYVLKVTNTGTVNAFIALGTSGVVATTGGIVLAAGDSWAALQGSVNTKIAAITSSGATSLTIESGTGVPMIVTGQVRIVGGGGGGSSTAITGFGSLAVANASTLASTVTAGPSSAVWPVAPGPLIVMNDFSSVGNLYVCPLGGTCTVANGLELVPGRSWQFQAPASTMTVISASSSTAQFQW